MSALMTPRRSQRGRRTRPAPAPGGQSALFGAGSAPAAAPSPEAVAAPAHEAVAAPAPEAVAAPAPEAVAAPAPEAVAAPAHEAVAVAPPAEAVGAAPAAAAVAAPAEETLTTARAHRHGPTLDDLVAGAWEGLLAGATADCFVCGASLAPRHSAGAGIVGGRCGGCGTTVS